MMKKFFIVICVFYSSLCYTQSTAVNYNGVSAITGNLKPEGATYGISLQNELIHVRELDTAVLYDVLYEFKNTTTSYGNFTVMQPITIYFNEFRAGMRSDMLDKLGVLFSDVFKVQDASIDIRKQLKENFGDRLFIRRYVSSQNLKALGIIADIFKNNQKSQYKKILVEFKWIDEDPYNLNKNTEVLVMEIKFSTDFTFNPGEQIQILSFMKLPPTVCGIQEKQIYTPYQIGYDKNWEGSIQNLYIRHDAFDISPILPSSFSYTANYIGERDQVLLIKNILPANKQRIGFYTTEENRDACGNNVSAEQLLIPSAIKNITSSSNTKEELHIVKRNYKTTNQVIVSDSLQAYQTGNPTDLDFIKKDFRAKVFPSELNTLIKTNCKNGETDIALQQGGHPVYAFDISNFDEKDTANTGKPNLQMQTCWCEGAAGKGKGEYIEFELTQPVSYIRIYNGNWFDEKSFTEGSKADIIRFYSVDGTFEDGKKDKTFSIIDLKIQNLYTLKLQPGKYRIYIDDATVGKNETSCISSISFSFDFQDEWFRKSMDALQNVYKKPK